MISFLQFFEAAKKVSDLTSVPRDLLGVSTLFTDLPDNAPYGFWVDRSGNFKVVGRMRHNSEAAKIIAKANNYLERHRMPLIKVYDMENDPYDRLFENGWIRVVLRPEARDIYYSGARDHLATGSQLRFLNFIKDLYEMKRVEKKF